MKKWIAILLIAVMALGLIACGSKDEPVSDPKKAIIGTWILKDVEGEGEEVAGVDAFGAVAAVPAALFLLVDGRGLGLLLL